MAGWIVHALRIAGAVASLGGAVWSIVAWIWGGGLAAVFSLLGPPEYAALATMFSVMFSYSTWRLCEPFLPSRRLEAMSESLQSTRRSLSFISNPASKELKGHYAEDVRMVARALDEITIPHPPVAGKNVVVNWLEFLIRIHAEARIGNIRCARSVWKELKQEQEG